MDKKKLALRGEYYQKVINKARLAYGDISEEAIPEENLRHIVYLLKRINAGQKLNNREMEFINQPTHHLSSEILTLWRSKGMSLNFKLTGSYLGVCVWLNRVRRINGLGHPKSISLYKKDGINFDEFKLIDFLKHNPFKEITPEMEELLKRLNFNY